MPTILFVTLVVVLWVSAGLTAVSVFLGRHGRRSWSWYIIGAVLGPVMLPIAAEMTTRTGRVLHVGAGTTASFAPSYGLTALVAVDGSAESDRAVHEAGRVLAGSGGKAVLLTVLDPDDSDLAAENDADALLAERCRWLSDLGAPAVTEVCSGDPVDMILKRADADDVDLIAVGRRGRGFSRFVLGSVADQVVRRSDRPVLLSSLAREEMPTAE